MKRYHPKTGEVFLPHRYKDGGYRVADPSLGETKHHSKNQIAVPSMLELVQYARRGFYVRMRGVDNGQINLVRPEDIDLSNIEAPPKGFFSAPEAPHDPLGARAETITIPNVIQLPKHGRIACGRCFGGNSVDWGHTSYEPGDGWSVINNPMAWGSRTPSILVLGFSKGGNQNDEILERHHNEVAFRGGRANLSKILETLGLKPSHRTIDQLIAEPQGDFAFGSLVRCSVKKRDGDGWLMSGKDIMSSCLRDRQMGTVISNCISEFLSDLPASVRLVVMLGNDIKYIEGCYSAISENRPGTKRINAVAYGDERVVFAHAVHFKAQGATIPEWANGVPGIAKEPDKDQALKRQLAMEAVSFAMRRQIAWDGKHGKLYHGSASTNRASIRERGLVLDPMNGETEESVTGGFFFSSQPPEHSEHIDGWEVNVDGLHLQIDDTDLPFNPDDTWWVLYGRTVIEPWRLRLLNDDE